MTNTDLAPDPPHNPLLRFDEEPLASPTASFEKAARKKEFKVLVAAGPVPIEVVVRDSRPLKALIAAWIRACNIVNRKGHAVDVAMHATHIATSKPGEFNDDPPAPPQWTLDLDDLVIFEGDENGEKAAAYPGDLIKGIACA